MSLLKLFICLHILWNISTVDLFFWGFIYCNFLFWKFILDYFLNLGLKFNYFFNWGLKNLKSLSNLKLWFLKHRGFIKILILLALFQFIIVLLFSFLVWIIVLLLLNDFRKMRIILLYPIRKVSFFIIRWTLYFLHWIISLNIPCSILF